MNNHIVKSHEFEKSKKKLQTFSKKLPNTSGIKSVPETTFFGFLNSNVTGEDLNEVIKIFQNRSIQTNHSLKKIIEEFKTIYDTFESLDKDYIQSIIIAVKSAEESSKQAVQNYKITESLISKLQYKFENIESHYEVIKSDVNTVTDASVKINNIKHLEDIDATYIQTLENKATIYDLNNNLINSRTELKKSIDKTTESLDEVRVKQNELKLDIAEKLKVSTENSLKNTKENSSKLDKALDEIRVKQNELKLDIVESLKVSTENSLKITKEFSNKMAEDFDEIRVKQNDLKLDIVESLKVSTENSLKINKEFSNKMVEDLDEIRVNQNDLKLDIVERLKISTENSLKNNKEYSNKMDKGLDEIRVKQNDLKIDIVERLKVSTENSLKANKKYSNKLTFVSIIAVLSLILSISMIVINLMNNVS